MKTLKNNPASFHYHTILKDAVINPTKAYFLNSWQCSSPDECQEYAIAILRKKFDYSEKLRRMKMRLIIEVKNVYGVPRVYPVCAKSHSFARIAGLKTLSPEVIEEIKKMGYKLTEEKKEI
jgi:hypothetical protein